MSPVPETRALELVHRVRVVHGGTGELLEYATACLMEPAWPHWVLRTRRGWVLLAVDDRFRDDRPESTRVRVVVPAQDSARFEAGGVAELELERDGAEAAELVLEPVPVALEVLLLRQTGKPREGVSVEARANGTAVPLPEVGGGVYRSAPRAWGPAFRPCRIHVNGAPRGQTSLDYSRPVTRVRLIVP
jgi:hypothetical protein